MSVSTLKQSSRGSHDGSKLSYPQWMNYSKNKMVLARLQVQASDLEQDFTYTVKVVKVDLEPVEYV